jgi:uncharacterized protein
MIAPIQTKQELIDLIHTHESKIRSYGVVQLGIFGSFVRDQANATSDVDLFIHFTPESKTLKNFVGLANYLQTHLGRKVEIVTPESLNRFIGKYIQQEVEYVALAA